MIRRLFQSVTVVIFLSVGVALCLGVAFVWVITRSIPPVSALKAYHHPHATEVFSAEGRKIGEFTNERRYPVQFEKIPRHVVNAFVASEDSKFFEHNGIDLRGFGRALWSNLSRGRFAQGGSTITQQVARLVGLDSRKKEITRKIREIILALRMEKELTKSEILALYLSEIYLGHGAHGIGAAARNYFHKNVEDLTVAEGAIIAGLPQRPNDWNPFHNPDSAKKRQSYVLRRMVDEGFLTQAEADKAFNEPIRVYPIQDLNNEAAPYFVEYVRQYLMNKYGSEEVLSQGYKVYTTVKYENQKAAEVALERGVREADKRMGWRGVTANLATETERQDFRASVHKEVMEGLMPSRILAPDAGTKGTKTLDYDLAPFQSREASFVGETPLAPGRYYRALVVSLDDGQPEAEVRVGLTRVIIPAAGWAWVKVDDKPVKKPSEFLKLGDTIQVRVEKIDKKAGLAYASVEQEPEITGALLSYDVKNGFVRAMVGGLDFRKSKFNCALQAKRQVGSTFKPFIYAAAFDKGFSPASLVTDSPIVFKYEGRLDADAGAAQGENWKPHNYGNKFAGEIPLRLALIRSMNIPTVKLLSEIGVDYGISYARTLGITAPLPRDLTIALGSWSTSLEEVMRAYAIFPRLGKPVVLNYITKVEDPSGKIIEELPALQQAAAEGEKPLTQLLADSTQDTTEQVISPQTAYVMTDMLKAVVREGTGHSAMAAGPNMAGKTGTSNDHRDAWFVGYSPQMMAGVWIGYLKDKALDSAETGGQAAAPIWAEYMKAVKNQLPGGDFPVPPDIEFAYIDRFTGQLAGASNPNRVRMAFKAGGVPDPSGSNIARVGEPGVRATAQEEKVSPSPASEGDAQGTSPLSPSEPVVPLRDEETSDFQRQGYD